MKLFVSISLLFLCCTGSGQTADYIIGRFVTVGSSAAPPITSAGVDQAITSPVSSVVLSGRANDPGGISLYAWVQLTGAPATIVSPSSASTTITGLTTGSYSFELTATGATGLVSKDTVSITVNAAANVPPVVSAGSDQTITQPTDNASLVATASDADGTISAYQWSQVSGPNNAVIVSPTFVSTTVSGLIVGVYKFQVKVTDNAGAIAIDEVQVTSNQAPEWVDTSGHANPNGRNFYFASWGNDSRTASQAQNPQTPWKTISKLNAIFSTLLPGDSLLFRTDNTFHGSVIINKSGTATRPIVLSSYGTGAKPIITGFTTLTGWTNNGSGRWTINVPGASTALSLVTINDSLQRLGRYPNADAADSGYLSYSSSTGSTTNTAIPVTITGTALSSVTNWTGAEVAIRKQHWIIDRHRITAHSAGTLTYPINTTGNKYFGKAGYGYFFQDDIRTLDQRGEWFLNKTTRDLSVYFGSEDPASHTVKAATIDTVINAGNRTYITLNNLAIEGGNKIAVYAKDAQTITVKNCSIKNSFDGIYMWNVLNSLSENNHVSNILNNGIAQYGQLVIPTVIRNNTISKCGLFAGMGATGDGSYCGIRQNGNNATIEYNRIDSIGYNALEFQGNNVNVRYNNITNYCMTKDDGGGIYTWSSDGQKTYSNRVVSNNTVIAGIGAPQGTVGNTTDAQAIYMDGGANNVHILNNIISKADGAAVFMNNAINIRISGNTIFDVPYGLFMQRFAGQQKLRNIIFTSNKVYPTVSNIFYWNAEMNTPTATNIQDDLSAIGTIDSNYVRNDITAPFDWFYHQTAGGTFVDPASMSLGPWQGYTGYDAHSDAIATTPARFEHNPTGEPVVIALGGTYYGVDGTMYAGSITLQPYTSEILVQPEL